jgi:hypothetical protein
MRPQWSVYEDAARKVLCDLRDKLGLSTVEGKQSLVGLSGTTCEIDAKAWRDREGEFLLVEARRHTKSGLKQEALAAIAYRIQDVGASGGVVVTPLLLQQGAALVARSAGIAHVHLTPESTTESYLAEFLGQRFIGASITESISVTDQCDAAVARGTPMSGRGHRYRGSPDLPIARSRCGPPIRPFQSSGAICSST